MNTPGVSVIIPLYNAEKYIAECLESILAQTFQDFEVIVVDDCSTDNSVAIVKSYIPKFGGRLKLSYMDENSGSGSLPRNKGLNLSRGEYIFNIDNDDAITPTALEELYTLAKKFDTDVVYCEKFYSADTNLKTLSLTSMQGNRNFVDKPILEPELLSERVNRILQCFFWVTPWSKFVRRDFLIENKIFFPKIIRDDDIWTWHLLFRAKKFLRVPNVVYIWRKVENSITRIEKTPAQEITFWLNPVILGVNTLDGIMGKMDFFKKNLNYRYGILNFFVEISFFSLLKFSVKLSPFEIYDVIREKFSDALDKQAVLVPLLCTIISKNQQIFLAEKQNFNHFAVQAQNRIKELEGQLKFCQQQLAELRKENI